MNDFYHEIIIKTNQISFVADLVFSFEIDAIEEKDDGLIIRSDEDIDNLLLAFSELQNKIKELNLDFIFEYTVEKKANRDWINEYKNNIQPLLIDDVYIHTTWQEGMSGVDNIIIDPALAFGSGHHETTYSCVKLINKYYVGKKTALDVGCGSGILSLVLAKKGLLVDLCDTDELAVASANKNFELNNIKYNKIWKGSCSELNTKYDVVVANIIADVILILKSDLKKALNKDGILILSGILTRYSDRIKKQFSDLELIEETVMNDWLSLVYKVKNEK